VRRTVPPSAEIKASIERLLARAVVDDPQKMLSELARLGARLIIQRAVEDEFDQWLGRTRYERRPAAGRGSAMCSVLGMCRQGRASCGSRSCRSARRRCRSSRGCPEVVLQAAIADRPAQGVGDRRVRARHVDARPRVDVRRGRAREDLEIDCRDDLRGAARAVRGVQAPLALRHQPRRAVARRDLPPGPPQRPEGRRDVRLGNH
jgi:hypothetical protein